MVIIAYNVATFSNSILKEPVKMYISESHLSATRNNIITVNENTQHWDQSRYVTMD